MALIIRGGTVVNSDYSRRADVLVDGETIAAIGPALDAPTGAEAIDAGGCYVMPGGIDPHTHLELPFMGSVSSAALVPHSKSSLDTLPMNGSSRWVCGSMPPGMT